MKSKIILFLTLFSCFSFSIAIEDNYIKEECASNVFPDFEDISIRYMIKDDHEIFSNLSRCLETHIDCAELNPSFPLHRLETTTKLLYKKCKDSYKRMTIILADGTYFYDTMVPPPQENHNSRISVMTAHLSRCGIGWEKKYSTITKTPEHYFAKRCDSPTTGWHLGSYIVRISK